MIRVRSLPSHALAGFIALTCLSIGVQDLSAQAVAGGTASRRSLRRVGGPAYRTPSWTLSRLTQACTA